LWDVTKTNRRLRRRTSTDRIDRPARERVVNDASAAASVQYQARAAVKSPVTSAGTAYDPQKHILSELKYSALVAVVIAVLLVVAYILFR
jgi:hypothetical protein